MHIEGEAGRALQRPDDRRADRQVRNEVAVHDVHVDEIRSSSLGRGQRVRQAGEVRREERRRDRDAHRATGAAASEERETVSETTSRLEMGDPAGGNCFRIVFAATPSYAS